jgi:UDP-N-acetylmuramoyl-L-alanyl-D-glutamate--2,6-diaminopimelate ligase
MKKNLNDIIQSCKVISIVGNPDRILQGLAFNSHEAGEGVAFFAIVGSNSDGHNYIQHAIEAGTKTVFCEKIPTSIDSDCTYILVENTSFSLAMAAAAFYDHPSNKIILTGVTGTNGKTTVATLLHQLFEDAGFPSGLISTICNKVGHKAVPSTHTTPDPVHINALLSEMVEAGCSHAFMEVSSHAMTQMRTFGLKFKVGIFTNLTHDHLDYHGTFASYRDAKKLFFDLLPKDAYALVNIDDKNGIFMTQNTLAKIKTFSISNIADFHARIIENQFEGLLLKIAGQEVFTKLIGRFNASNLLAIYGAAELLGMERQEILIGISRLQSAEGRFEWVKSSEGIIGIVDYAHTPDALQNVLKTIDAIRTHNEQLITVAGAGGNRDKTKRPEMARIAAEFSNTLILTSDNPRNEDPLEILEDMRKGISGLHYKKHLVIADRKEAIKTAFMLAKPGDIILVAGKGHEKYQEIKGVKYPFDDRAELIQLFDSLQQTH